VDAETAYSCAQQCGLNAIAAVKAELGDLDLVKRVVKVGVYVASAPDFTAQDYFVQFAATLESSFL
jgi:hypothetical protein